MTSTSTLLAVLLLTSYSLVSQTAFAFCFQRVGGVPPAYGQAPEWWNSGAPLQSNVSLPDGGVIEAKWIEDPRWQGASGLGAAGDGYRFRGLFEQQGSDRFLVLMWHVRADPMSATADERIYFGFADNDASLGKWVFEILPNVTTATPQDGNSAFIAHVYLFDSAAGEWERQAVTPAWITAQGRVDLFCPEEPCDEFCPEERCDEWAFRVRVPLGSSAVAQTSLTSRVPITAGGDYKFFYQVTNASNAGIAYHKFPQGLAPIALSGGDCATGDICPDSPSNWASITGSGTCQGDISLNASQIYVTTPGNTTIGLTAVNPIHARPKNNQASALPVIPGNDIGATFRLANWGSTIGASPAWQPLLCNGRNVPFVPGAGGGVGSGAQFDIVCNYEVPPAERCRYGSTPDPCGNGAEPRHYDQCVLVELSTAPGAGVSYSYSPQSAWRNLQFTGASKVTKSAAIDIRGLAPNDPPRSIYAYVQTRNMPTRVTGKTPRPRELLSKELLTKLQRLEVPLPDGQSFGKETATALQDALARGEITDDEVRSFMPSYAVHVWHDSGEVHEGRKVLVSQPSFEYVIWHDGALEGWRHEFAAPGSTITELAPNYYEIAVPQGGLATVVTTIEALESAKHWWCWPWLWALVFLVLILAVALFKWLLRGQNPQPAP